MRHNEDDIRNDVRSGIRIVIKRDIMCDIRSYIISDIRNKD